VPYGNTSRKCFVRRFPYSILSRCAAISVSATAAASAPDSSATNVVSNRDSKPNGHLASQSRAFASPASVEVAFAFRDQQLCDSRLLFPLAGKDVFMNQRKGGGLDKLVLSGVL